MKLKNKLATLAAITTMALFPQEKMHLQKYAKNLNQFAKENSYEPYNETDILSLYKNNISLEDALKYSSYENKNRLGYSGNNAYIIKKIKENGMTIDDFLKLYNIKNEDSTKIFHHDFIDEGYSLRLFVENGGNLEKTKKLLKIRNNEDEQLYKKSMSYVNLDEKINYEKIAEYAKIEKDSLGTSFFSIYDTYNLNQFINEEITKRKIESIIKEESFSSSQLLRFIQNGGNEHIAKEYNKKTSNETESFLNFMVGISPSEMNKFTDTEKPNALITIPEYDRNGIFSNSLSVAFFRGIRKNYDVLLNFTKNDSALLKSLQEIKDPELLLLCGHGNGKTMTLGNANETFYLKLLGINLPSFATESMGPHVLDTNDFAIKTQLKYIGDPTLFLYSCKAGRELGKNIHTHCPNLNVISSTESFGLHNVTIYNYYPLDLTIRINGEDVTYKKASNIKEK